MNQRLWVLFALLSLAFGCGRKLPEPDGTQNRAGTYYQSLVTPDGVERQYIVYVPESAAGADEVPVLIMVHGTNQSGQVHYDKDLWNPKADAEGFIVVYPTALVYCHFDQGVQRTTTKWAAGDLGQTDLSAGALPLCEGEVLRDDMAFFDALVAEVKADFVVDAKRLYLSGFSNGAQMTARLALQRADVFAAATVHAGNLSAFLPHTPAPEPISLVVTVGASDGLLLDLIGASGPLPVDSTMLGVAGMQGLVQPFLDMGDLAGNYTYSEQIRGGVKLAQFHYSQSLSGGGNTLTFVGIEGLGHSYTELLIDPYWDFLKTKSLP